MKEKNNFDIIHIHELPSIFNREIGIDAEMLKKCSLAYLIVLQHRETNEAVGLHVSIQYITSDKKVLMQEGATIVAKVDGWDEMSHEEVALRESLNVKALVDYGLAFVSGMVFRRSSGTVMNNIFVPHMNTSGIMSNVIIEKLNK